MQADERKDSEVSFLLAAVAYYEQLGVKTKRQITGNGSAYRSQLFAKTSQVLGIKHTFAQPCGPKPTARPSASFIPTSAHGPLASPGSTAPSVPPVVCLPVQLQLRAPSLRSGPQALSLPPLRKLCDQTLILRQGQVDGDAPEGMPLHSSCCD